MTDRELLELAAKAIQNPENYANEAFMRGFYSNWNPLKDDGDALRLATALCFSVIQYKHSMEIMIGDELIHRELSDGTMTRLELTRRAITRAAAEIGKAMP